MTDHNLVEVTFTEGSKAYEAMSDLKRAAAEGRIAVRSAVILEREPDGRLQVAEGQDASLGDATAGGALVGALVGLLGGPLGLLLGWGAGAVGGSLVDARRADRSETLIGDLSTTLEPGVTAIVAEVHEVTPEVLDGVMTPLDGQVTRHPAEQVLAQIEAAEDAAEAAQKEADRVLREQKREHRKEEWNERVDRLRARFDVG